MSRSQWSVIEHDVRKQSTIVWESVSQPLCVEEAGETVVIAIQTGDVIAGNVPARALRLV